MTRRGRRVVIVADAKFPVHEPFAGGMQALTWHLAKGLKQRGISVCVFAAPGTDPELGAETLAVSELELSLASRNDVSMQPRSAGIARALCGSAASRRIAEAASTRSHPQSNSSLSGSRSLPSSRHNARP